MNTPKSIEIIKSPNHDPKRVCAPQEIEQGKRMAESAHRWMERSQSLYLQMAAFVKDLRRRGVTGRVRDQIIIHFTKISDQNKPMFTLTNGDWAGISRYMILEDPTLEGNPIRLAHSAIDDYGLIPVSWMHLQK